jgi:phosphate transport system ATP-binding protein
MTQQAKIVIKNLSFYYGKKQVIFGVNLDIPENEILAIFGPANSATTTLLRSLPAVRPYSRGSHGR